MARQITTGFEIGGADTRLDCGSPTGASPTFSSAVVRSGTTALKATSGGLGTTSLAITDVTTGTPSTGTKYWTRFYFNLPSAGASNGIIAKIGFSPFDISTSTIQFILNANGNGLTLYVNNSAVGPTPAITTNQWYRVELYYRINGSTSDDELAWQLDGVSQYSTITANLATAYGGIFRVQLGVDSVGNNVTCYFDDLAVNDNSGTTQNSWPGEGKVVLLKAVSDNAIGSSWYLGRIDTNGVAFNLADGVDNTPPIGSASLSAAAGDGISNIAKDTVGNYDANLTTYRNAGIADTDTVVLVEPIFNVSADTKNSTAGAEQFVSNPTGPAETSINFNNSAAAGTWPTNWRTDRLAAIVGDIATANRGTNPVIRVGKRQSTANGAYCDFMGAYVEYYTNPVPNVGALTTIGNTPTVSQATGAGTNTRRMQRRLVDDGAGHIGMRPFLVEQ